MLTEPNGFVLDLLVYTSAKYKEVAGAGHSDKVVKKLMEKYLNTGHSLYMDNYYTSVRLSTELIKEKTYNRNIKLRNRKGNPSKLLEEKLKKEEQSEIFTEEGMKYLLKWYDKHEVLMLSSEYSGKLVLLNLRSGKVVNKPEMVFHYNKHMGEVDRTDQLMAYYPLERKSIRWYVKFKRISYIPLDDK